MKIEAGSQKDSYTAMSGAMCVGESQKRRKAIQREKEEVGDPGRERGNDMTYM